MKRRDRARWHAAQARRAAKQADIDRRWRDLSRRLGIEPTNETKPGTPSIGWWLTYLAAAAGMLSLIFIIVWITS